MTLRLVFMGSPDFAVPALRALVAAGHEVVAAYAQPPKPAGRGQQMRKTPVQDAAEAMGIEVRTPKSLKKSEEQEALRALAPDALVVAAYGLILPQAVLDIPRLGCFNIHGSLLPRWRGAAPLQRAMLAGDSQTGITIMQMDAGLDTGAMLMKGVVPMTGATTAESLHDEMATLGAKLIVEAMEEAEAGKLKPVAQSEEGMTYAAKLTREDGRIDWQKSAEEVERQVRALTPWPGTFFMKDGEAIKVLKAEIVTVQGEAGTLLDEAFTVACGADALRIVCLQRAGKKAMSGQEALRGWRLPVGEKFE